MSFFVNKSPKKKRSVEIVYIVCNWKSFPRAMILKPTLEMPIDTTKDLVLQGKIPTLPLGLWGEYLATSSNQWHRKAKEIAIGTQNPSDMTKNLELVLKKDGKHCAMASQPDTAYAFKDYKNAPAIHFSRENLRPYYSSWVISKQSPWKDILDKHIGITQQV